MIKRLNIIKNGLSRKTNFFHINYFSTKESSFKINPIRHENNLKGYVDFFRSKSHKFAKIDPLGLAPKKITEDFNISNWGLSEIEKIEEFPLDSYLDDSRISELSTIHDLKNYLNKLYLNHCGVEFSHIDDQDEKKWLYENYERIMLTELDKTELVNAFKVGYPIELFEGFLNTKFGSFKRYSGEGLNSIFIGLFSLLSDCSLKSNAVKEVVFDMQHRGRLNILPFLFDYPFSQMFHKMSGKRDIPANIEAIDDVISHISTSNKKLFYSKGNINDYEEIVVTMVHNPSHLEAVCPVSMGKSLAKIDDYDGKSELVLNIHIHGDAALAGQGVNYEMMNLNKTPGGDIGGSIHIVSNNQIGYTTDPHLSRSTPYCTDLFKTFDVPIIHVNSEDVESVIKVFRLSLIYKEKFKKDFVIDVVGYRKYGHNEVDEPSFTQPLMYKSIRGRKSYIDKFKESLISRNILTEENVISIDNKFKNILNEEYKKSQNLELNEKLIRSETYKGNKTLTKKWSDMELPQHCPKDNDLKTGINSSLISLILKESVKVPQYFNIHPRLKQYFVDARLNNLEKGIIDWPSAESLAFGSLLNMGFNIRLSGEDVTRGTFSQRHIGFYDQHTNNVYLPFQNNKNLFKGRLAVNNSILSEFAQMLFDYGYSLESPKNLVIWEAQFGDFVNGSQIAIDQFISSGESKWLRQSGLVLLLPHGYDGTGPEHSNCRYERFLQNTVTNGINRLYKGELPDNRSINYSVCNLTTSSNYFHVLRRQMLRKYRKPLVIATPKVGLRNALYNSHIESFDINNNLASFQPIIISKFYKNPESIDNIVFCSGQIFLEVIRLINSLGKNTEDYSLMLVRIEEIAPFPEELIKGRLKDVNKKAKLTWLQEEGINAGAYFYVEPHLARIANSLNFINQEINYIGRNAEIAANGCLEISKKESLIISEKITSILQRNN